tara:strand:- start:26341 stop:27402 length:1062 start_codon:yes stop_codon:yes gene_type:complete
MRCIEKNEQHEPLLLGGRGIPGERLGAISGTQWAALLGMSKYRGPHDLWLRIKGIEPEIKTNRAMMEGRRLEPIVCELGEQKLGVRMREQFPETQAWVKPYSQYFHHSIDRRVYDMEDNLIGVFEAKTMGTFGTWGEAGPPAYRLQLQSYLWAVHLESMAAGKGPIDVGWLGCLNAPSEALGLIQTPDDAIFAIENGCATYHLHQFERDQAFMDQVIPYAIDWYERHIIGDTPPAADASDSCVLALRKHYGWTDKEIEADEEIEALAVERLELADQIKELTERKKLTDNRLRQALRGAKKAQNHRVSVSLSRVKGRAKFDEGGFKEAYPELHEQYVKQGSGYEKFTVRKRDAG